MCHNIHTATRGCISCFLGTAAAQQPPAGACLLACQLASCTNRLSPHGHIQYITATAPAVWKLQPHLNGHLLSITSARAQVWLWVNHQEGDKAVPAPFDFAHAGVSIRQQAMPVLLRCMQHGLHGVQDEQHESIGVCAWPGRVYVGVVQCAMLSITYGHGGRVGLLHPC